MKNTGYVVATDLDRTLLPNGKQEYDNSMDDFKEIIKKENIKLIFVTGRHLGLVEEAMKNYNTPVPDYIITEVGTRIYFNVEGKFLEDKQWEKKIHSELKGWNVGLFREKLSKIKELRLQEFDRQNPFKLSYYIDDTSLSEDIVKKVTSVIKKICGDASIVYSVDETHNIGLLDILPRMATKLTALEYLRKKMGIKKADLIYCGDSGNDILPLTAGYKAILVRNAIEEVKNTVKNLCMEKDCLDLVYFAEGNEKYNGYYVSGIMEGLGYFGVTSS